KRNGCDSDQPYAFSSFNFTFGLGTPFQTVAKHQDANSDQDQRPHSRKTPKREPVEIVQQEERAHPNQNDWSDWPVLAPGFERIDSGCTSPARLRGAHRIKGHVDHKACNKQSERDSWPGVQTTAYADDHRREDYDVNQCLIELAVVNGAQSRNKAQHECNACV